MFRQAFPWLALGASLLVIFYQRRAIGTLQSQVSSFSIRTKRSTEDNSLYVPVYAQISRKAMKRLCRQQTHSLRYATQKVEETTQAATTTTTPRDRIYRKRCKSDVTFGPPRLVAIRPHSVGSAIRDGENWYVTEYHLGYSLLHFVSARALNSSSPHNVYTLQYPFQGTDNVVYNRTAYFNYVDAVMSYDLKKETSLELKVPLGKGNLYGNWSTSLVDIQAEEHGLWALYRRQGDNRLTVRRIVPKTMKVVSSWLLEGIDPTTWCNSFIRCGLLYSVECTFDGLHIQPVYDFYQNMPVAGKRHFWKDIGPVSSVQYDPRSRSITVFSAGKIYNVQTV